MMAAEPPQSHRLDCLGWSSKLQIFMTFGGCFFPDDQYQKKQA
jgi:hypothetical protein